MSDQHIAYLGLGSNLGDRQGNLIEARRQLASVVEVSQASSIYETEPWGFEDQPSFLNQVLCCHTNHPPQALLDDSKEIERRMGRQATFRYGPRLIDIDILVYDQVLLVSDGLTLPHPRLTERAFVLIPMVEIAPDLVIPGTGQTASEWAARLDSADSVVRWTPEDAHD